MPLTALLQRDARSPSRPFTVTTPDGVRLAGAHFDQAATDLAVVYGHGFLANRRHLAVPRFLERLSARFDVLSFDYRGHGDSSGTCSLCGGEADDLEAVVGHARALGYRRVVTVGSSMGGATAIRHAGLFGGVAGVATIGAFADARAFGSPITELGRRLFFRSALGPPVAAAVYGTRIGQLEEDSGQPVEVVGHIAPTPLLLIHGAWDPLVLSRDARILYAQAGEPKELVIVPRSGHDTSHLATEATVDRLVDWIGRQVTTDR